MIERTVPLEIDAAYANLKTALEVKGCRVISETAPNQILVKQGSLWGISPTTAKKNVKANLVKVDSGTKIACSSQLSSDWKNLTIVGCVFAAALVGVCLWITLDLTAFMATLKPSFWSWLITVNGNVDRQIGSAFVRLTESLAVFLSVIIILEVGILVYTRARIDGFAKEILGSL